MKFLILNIIIIASSVISYSQKTVDQIIATVGREIVLQSDVENQYMQMLIQGQIQKGNDKKCPIFEELIYSKMLLTQAKIDSITVSESEIKNELDRRLRYFVSQIGSEKELEDFYGKSINEIKDDFKSRIEEQLLTQRMQQKITANIKGTPKEVQNYYNSIPKDSLPYISSKLEIGQIVISPQINDSEKKKIIEKAQNIKERLVNGESFRTLAVLYSDDPGSATKGGELGFIQRGQLVPEFEAVAFNLKKGEVSEIVESQFGYHIIELIEKRGEMINVRHILLQPKVSMEDLQIASIKLDSIRQLIVSGKISFEEAATKYSTDKQSSNNGGLMINPYTNTTKFEANQVDPSLMFTINKLNKDEISKPLMMNTPSGKQGFRIVYLKSKTNPHTANLVDDYQEIMNSYLIKKKEQEMKNWILKNKHNIYINIKKDYLDCNFKYNWFTTDTTK